MGRYPKIHPIALTMDHTFRCKVCKMPENLGNYLVQSSIVNKMRENQLCYQCAFWLNEIEHPSSDREIIGGKCYVIHPAQEDLSNFEVGDGPLVGASCYVFRPDWKVYRSFAMYLLGIVPTRFRSQLPDTAQFITPRAFRKIVLNGDFKCKAKGCWDRYHCLRYDMECEKDGPFNTIPSFYKVGDESCSSFINKDKDLFV